MVISSLVIETLPDAVSSVSRALSSLDGVEVHGTNSNQVVITIEAETIDDSHSIAGSFISMEGVTGINLVYGNFEDDPS